MGVIFKHRDWFGYKDVLIVVAQQICLLVITGSNYLVPDFLLEKDLDLDLITPQ